MRAPHKLSTLKVKCKMFHYHPKYKFLYFIHKYRSIFVTVLRQDLNYTAQARLELVTLLPQPPECYHRHTLLDLASGGVLKVPLQLRPFT